MLIVVTGKETAVFLFKFIEATVFPSPKINCILPTRGLKKQAVIKKGVIFNFGSKEGLQCFKEFYFLQLIFKAVACKLLLYQVPVAVGNSKTVFQFLMHAYMSSGRLLQLYLHMAIDEGAVLFHIALVEKVRRR